MDLRESARGHTRPVRLLMPTRSSCFAAGSVSGGITSNVTLLKAQLAP
jgi:hypothetical protein